jgi:hypothetical protein
MPITAASRSGARANLTPRQREFDASQPGIGEKDLALAVDACRRGPVDRRMIDIEREFPRRAMTGGQSQFSTLWQMSQERLAGGFRTLRMSWNFNAKTSLILLRDPPVHH